MPWGGAGPPAGPRHPWAPDGKAHGTRVSTTRASSGSRSIFVSPPQMYYCNGRDYDVDMGQELASMTVTMLLIGLHVFVTVAETGELLRELRLNPDHDFRPE